MGRSKDTPGPPMTLGNMRELGVKLGLIAALFRGRYPPDGGREPKNAANSNARKLPHLESSFESRSQRSRTEAAYSTHVVTQNSLELGFRS
jgi:hypothetical protein